MARGLGVHGQIAGGLHARIRDVGPHLGGVLADADLLPGVASRYCWTRRSKCWCAVVFRIAVGQRRADVFVDVAGQRTARDAHLHARRQRDLVPTMPSTFAEVDRTGVDVTPSGSQPMKLRATAMPTATPAPVLADAHAGRNGSRPRRRSAGAAGVEVDLADRLASSLPIVLPSMKALVRDRMMLVDSDAPPAMPTLVPAPRATETAAATVARRFPTRRSRGRSRRRRREHARDVDARRDVLVDPVVRQRQADGDRDARGAGAAGDAGRCRGGDGMDAGVVARGHAERTAGRNARRAVPRPCRRSSPRRCCRCR